MLNIYRNKKHHSWKKFLLFIPLVALLSAGVTYWAVKHFVLEPVASETVDIAEETAEEAVPESEREPVKMPENAVAIDDDFSGLQLEDCQKPVFDRYTLAERQAKGLPTAMPALTPYANGKVAYLTFDDGPDDKNTPAILDILANYGVKATFFVTGTMCETNPEVLKRIFAEGHAIGNHSYSHNYNKLYASKESFLAEITKTDEVIHKILGVRPVIIRAPGGTVGMFTDDYWPMLKENGYAEYDWNVSTEDATPEHPSPERELEHVDLQTRGALKDGAAIVLMHSIGGKENTVSALPSIIMLLQEKGYSFGVVTPMTPQPW